MATYVIGDLQGCFDALQRLLERLRFDPERDRLWFTGDLVNRGPASLACLRFVKALGPRARVVLGNHDLHLLAVALRGESEGPKDTLREVLTAPDREELLTWLRQQPLLHYDPELGLLLVHAGLPPQWTVAQALQEAQWAETQLRGEAGVEFLSRAMYGDQPDHWDAGLQGMDRLRFIINCCTRMRFVTGDGRLSLREKDSPARAPAGLSPWFAAPGRRSTGTRIVFGHWSTLGPAWWPEHQVWSIDGGCVWGRSLVALDVARRQLIESPCG